jgi:hypothetical protein
MACSGLYEFHILHALPGSLLPLSLYQRGGSYCFIRQGIKLEKQAGLSLSTKDVPHLLIHGPTTGLYSESDHIFPYLITINVTLSTEQTV